MNAIQALKRARYERVRGTHEYHFRVEPELGVFGDVCGYGRTAAEARAALMQDAGYHEWYANVNPVEA